jgi:hypothetical protein
MARATGLAEVLAPVPLELAGRDDVGLADQARPQTASLDLVAKRRGRQPELVGGFGEGQHRLFLGGGQILRRLVGDPRRLELGVRGPQSARRLDPVAEGSTRDQAVQADLRDPDRSLGLVDPGRGCGQGLEVRHLGCLCARAHAHNMADIGHEVKAARCPSATLTNPIYAGRLRTGEPAGLAPIVDPALWSRVQSMRELRRTRTPGRIVKRNYPLRLRCAGCQRFLYGDVGRYRHPAPTCDAFIAGTPDARRRYTKGDDKRVGGHSYPQTWYEDAIGLLLSEVGSVDDVTITEVVRRYHDRPPRVDGAALARVSREREESSRRLAKSRDVMAWQREMAQLDAEEEAARDPVEQGQLASSEVVAYLRSLPSLWADSGPDGRQALATALFARTDVVGFERMEYELTPDAIELGLGDALPAVFEIGQEREFGRGERARARGNDVVGTVRVFRRSDDNSDENVA